MNKKIFYYLMAVSIAFSTLFLTGCENDDEVSYTETNVKTIFSDGLENVSKDGLSVTFTNKSTGVEVVQTTNSAGEVIATLEDGLYDVKVTGTKTITYLDGSKTEQLDLVGLNENVTISPTTKDVNIKVYNKIQSKGWVIKEIYFTGVNTPENKAYNKDQFIEIYNNTDTRMYADGISIAEAINLTTYKVNLYASDIDKNTYIHTLYTIPGNGQEHPVEPGKSILIAPQPINHKQNNANSFDLSNADFQWYDAHSTLSVQVPEVADLIKYYSYSASIWLLSIQSNRSLLIFKADDMPNYYANNVDIRDNSVGKPTTSVKVANNLILDAVEIGKKERITTKAFAPSVDLSYTYCDDSGIGKSVRRKVLKTETNGRVIYQDTNNSADDFIPNATPQPKEFK